MKKKMKKMTKELTTEQILEKMCKDVGTTKEVMIDIAVRNYYHTLYD